MITQLTDVRLRGYVLLRKWQRICDEVGIKAHDVVLSLDGKTVVLMARRDGRQGASLRVPAIHLRQPGAETLMRGIALELRDQMDLVHRRRTGRPLIPGEELRG